MRILSQDGLTFNDIPYEKFVFGIARSGGVDGFCVVARKTTVLESGFPLSGIMAKYSTEVKARKAMDILHEQYARLCSLSTYLHGGMELFAKSISQKEAESFSVEYLNMNIFQFPADDEVEV